MSVRHTYLIEAATPEELKDAVAKAHAVLNGAPAPVVTEAPKSAAVLPSAVPAENKKTTATVAAPAPVEETEDDGFMSEETAEEEDFTLESFRAEVQKAVDAKGMPAVKERFGELGYTKLSGIPATAYAEVVAACREMAKAPANKKSKK